jgi:hypothetical protein
MARTRILNVEAEVVPPPEPVIADTFSRADTNGTSWGTTEIGGKAWTSSNWGNWRIQSQAAQPFSGGGNVDYAWINTGMTSYRYECDVEMQGDLYIIGSLIFRSNGTVDSSNWGQLMFSNGHSTIVDGLTLYNGSAGELGTYPFTFVEGNTHRLAVEVTETTIKAFLDGTEVMSVTDATNASFPMVGLRTIASYDTTSRYDNLEVYELV